MTIITLWDYHDVITTNFDVASVVVFCCYPVMRLTCILIALSFFAFLILAVSQDAVLIEEVKVLTLRENADTTHRRVSAISQVTTRFFDSSFQKTEMNLSFNVLVALPIASIHHPLFSV
jgi:hypothetical protein